jgi:tRNA U34 2-thiouridine synthase MnmA/TrmU
VELQVVHLTDEYWKLVVSHSISEIQAGQTPNPDILCNSHIKFGAFLQNVEDAQFDRIASGHYARVEHAAINGDFVGARLLLSADQVVKHLVYLTTFPQISLSPQSILLLVCVDFGCSESMGILVS